MSNFSVIDWTAQIPGIDTAEGKSRLDLLYIALNHSEMERHVPDLGSCRVWGNPQGTPTLHRYLAAKYHAL